MGRESEEFANAGINENCRTCTAACCGPQIKIVLSKEEKDFLQSAGTAISLAKSFPGNTNKNQYSLDSKCGFVVKEDGIYKCSVYNNPQRPASCNEAKAGGEDCRKNRELKKG
jgi:hypothetical protein